MNTVNRILVVLGVLAALVFCTALFLVPLPILRAVAQGMVGLLQALEGVRPVLRVVLGILFALAWVVICVLFLILELRRPRLKMVRLERVGGGEVEVSLGTVAEHIAYEVDQLPGVLRVHPRISARRGGVVVEMDVDAAGDLEVPVRAAQVIEVVHRVVEEKVGAKLVGPPKVRLRAAPVPPALRARVVRPGGERGAEEPQG